MRLIRSIGRNGVVIYKSPLLEHAGITHAFSTRIGGKSNSPFDSMNLGNPNGCAIQDQTQNITENYRLLMQSIDCENRPRFFLHQIHGAQVAHVRSLDFSNSNKGDALVTSERGFVLSVRVADCCPVLIATPDGKAVAAIHAGWRGAVGGVIQAAVDELKRIADIDPRVLIAAVGPCIGFDAFEVGPEVLERFEQEFGADAPVRHDGNGKGHVDLGRACRLQLLRACVDDRNIDLTNRCTYRDADEFFSHRRDNGVTGRMAALIATKL